MAVKKSDLPSKTCAVCARPFVWRRKWARHWDEVRYCSDAAAAGAMPAGPCRRPAEMAVPACTLRHAPRSSSDAADALR